MLLIIETLLFLASLRQDHRAAVEGMIFPLDKTINSVDDQYYGCRENMATLVEKEYLVKEKENSQNFRNAWKTSENAIGKWKFSKLKRTQEIAIHVYTGHNVYSEFNSDTFNGKENYKNLKYNWYSLYFLLIDAIQTLKKNQNRCFDTFRSTNEQFDFQSGEVGFGSFSSSSLDLKRANRFGTVSCFVIHTCEGAEVRKYSQYPDEKEVLIPPYEKFNVAAVQTKTEEPDLWCDTVYTLKSSGIRSDLNCALFNKH